jgi:hypothetical protein
MTTASAVAEAPVAGVAVAEAPPVAARPVAARYALRAVVVPASLAELHGPVSGLVELPQRLFWSGAERVFDLNDSDRLLEMYEAVFDAARTEADLAGYLNGETLARVWPRLALSPRVRRAWEAAHPDLARTGLTCPDLTSAEQAGTAPAAA